eukprot:360406-Chlamydomonas_euryale.AAC.4
MTGSPRSLYTRTPSPPAATRFGPLAPHLVVRQHYVLLQVCVSQVLLGNALRHMHPAHARLWRRLRRRARARGVQRVDELQDRRDVGLLGAPASLRGRAVFQKSGFALINGKARDGAARVGRSTGLRGRATIQESDFHC